MKIHYLVGLVFIATAGAAAAQYKYVSPDGRTTYSDLPPPANVRVLEEKRLGSNIAATVVLPFELQQASSKYPVTLYTGEKCAPCGDGRTYLRNRGVPFAEKTVTSDDDIEVFKRQSPDGTAPVLVVGSRKSIGFAESAWGSLLDDAGYPRTSKLPRDFQYPIAESASPNTKLPAQDVTRTAARTTRPAPRGQASVPGSIPSPSPEAPKSSDAPPGFRF